MRLQTIIDHLERIAPPELAEPWDNVGLLTGDPESDVERALLTIDYTAVVAGEATALGAKLIVAYHPPIFKEIKKVIAPSVLYDAIRNGVALYSPHTALDVADGGTNDLLADVLAMTTREPLRRHVRSSTLFKLVVFVPRDHAQAVSNALFSAGAGEMGRYRNCSFASAGMGTFQGDDTTHPAIGEPGKLERVEEIRLEMLVPAERTQSALGAIRQAHPYEEPAFDLFELKNIASTKGIGRVGTILPQSRTDLLRRIKTELGLKHLLVAGPTEGEVTRVACSAGSGGELVGDALMQKAELFLTGELRHHDALRAAAAGMTVVCTLHSNSERAVLNRLLRRLSAELPAVRWTQSQADQDPFSIH